MNTTPPPAAPLPALPPERLPQHVAIIMDGNGRWARRQGLPRFAGHRAGARVVRTIVEECARLGLRQLTLYSFSVENWKRPADEVNLLMNLYVEYLISQRPLLIDNNIRFVQIGRRAGLPQPVLDELDRTLALTAHHTGMTLCLAINYGARLEITDAVQAIARAVQTGALAPADITAQTISDHLYTAGMPDPDLLIRTAGEMRVSNYLLWQISYAEFYVTGVYWPDFSIAELHKAFENFAARHRRFGGLDAASQ